ncbi:bacteriohemerythrin [Thermopetrobacter sp. TC1]|uniref:bacteriohemerythrin n=1 Tax=Thermopetrobacter sp. TC1 TaxID=1495045 RepID=UPI00056F090F|nr:bacteriohemerythrin [Thermopetrobacter sp. TC1]
MVKLEWQDAFNTGIDLIDRQHQILVRAINLLSMGLEQGCEKDLMDDIFHTLADYTATHFADEERLFTEASFPEAEAHKRTHEMFLQRLNELKAKFDQGGDTAQEVLVFLVDWLKNHILGTDRKYIPYVLGEGGLRKAV